MISFQNYRILKNELSHPDVKYIEADQVMSINNQQDPTLNSPLGVITQTGATWVKHLILYLSLIYIYISQ